MTNKLTAKLSDGREFEVVNDMPTAEGSENRVMWLKPLKKEPREWWEVISPCDHNIVNSFTSREKAESFMQYFGASLNTYEIVHVREVVE